MEGESYGILKVRDALLFLVLRPFARTTNCKNINCPNNSTITAPAVNKVFIISVDSQAHSPSLRLPLLGHRIKNAVVYITRLHGRGLCPKSDATGVIRHFHPHWKITLVLPQLSSTLLTFRLLPCPGMIMKAATWAVCRKPSCHGTHSLSQQLTGSTLRKWLKCLALIWRILWYNHSAVPHCFPPMIHAPLVSYRDVSYQWPKKGWKGIHFHGAVAEHLHLLCQTGTAGLVFNWQLSRNYFLNYSTTYIHSRRFFFGSRSSRSPPKGTIVAGRRGI